MAGNDWQQEELPLAGGWHGSSSSTSNVSPKATTSLTAMRDAATKLVEQLTMARDIVEQMKKSSAEFASNMNSVSGSSVGGTKGSRGSTTPGVANSASDSTLASAAKGGVAEAAESGAGRGGLGRFGTAMGVAAAGLGYVAGATMNMMPIADNLAASDIATRMRMYNPGKFGNQQSALQYINNIGPASGLTQLDRLSLGQLQTSYNFTGNNFATMANGAILGQRLNPGMSQQDVNAAVAGFQNAQQVNALKMAGLNIRDSKGNMMSTPAEALSLLRVNLRGHEQDWNKGSEGERASQIEQAMVSGGNLDYMAKKEGWDANQRQLMESYWLAASKTNKPLSQVTEKDLEAVTNSDDFKNWRRSQEDKSTAQAGLTATTADAVDTATSAANEAITSYLHFLTDINENTKAISMALAGSAFTSAIGDATGGGPGGGWGGILGGAANAFMTASMIRSMGGKGLGAAATAAEEAAAAAGGAGAAGRAGGMLARLSGGAGLLPWLGRAGLGLGMAQAEGAAGDGLKNYLEHLGGGVKSDDHGGGSIARRFGSWLWGVGEKTLQGATAGFGVAGPLGAIGGAVGGMGLGAYQETASWQDAGWSYGTEDQANAIAAAMAGTGPQGAKTNADGTPAKDANTEPSPGASGLVGFALGWLGTPYSYGGGNASGPTYGIDQGAHTKGFDCSGFTVFVYAKFGVNLPRRSQEQARAGQAVSRGEARAGDLLIFSFAGEPADGHVGIYLGSNEMVHAPHTGDVVKRAPVPWGYVSTIRRVISGDKVGSVTGGSSATAADNGTSSTITDSGRSPLAGSVWTGHGGGVFGMSVAEQVTPPDPGDTAGKSNSSASASNTSVHLSGSGNNVAQVFNALVAAGFTRQAAAGVTGNLMGESTTAINPHLPGDHGTSYGIAQWHDSSPGHGRWTNLKNYAKSTKGDWHNLSTQVGFLLHELAQGGAGVSLGKLKSMTDVDAVVRQMVVGFERPRDPSSAIHIRTPYAEQVYREYGERNHKGGGKGHQKAFSEGAWRVNKDQLANIHEGEMILSRPIADVMRKAIQEGFSGGHGSGGGQSIVVHMPVTFTGQVSQAQAHALVKTFKETVEKASTAKQIRTR